MPNIILASDFGCSKNFAEVLERVGAKVEAVLYKGKTHTDLFLQVSKIFFKTNYMNYPSLSS